MPVYEAPGQQSRMISLLESQIEAQETAAQEIRSAAVDASSIIANELSHSADELRSAVSDLSTDLVDSIQQATNVIGREIDLWGNRVCASLLLIGWLSVQQSLRFSAVLGVLLNSRSNEARQLVKQGLRHLEVAEYSEAEERFALALSYDSTDYQALLNLAFVKAQQGDSSAAHTYFRKSVTLPENLDSTAKERGLWAWARLHYADGHYDSALETAQQAVSLQQRPTGDALFTICVYAGLKGDLALCISSLNRAIEIDPTFFARAAVEPDLETVRPQIIRLLSDLGTRAQVEAKAAYEQTKQSFARLLVDCKYVSTYDSAFISALQGSIFEGEQSLVSPSYTRCLGISYRMLITGEIIERLRELDLLHEKSKRLMDAYLMLARTPPQRRRITPERLGFFDIIARIMGKVPVQEDNVISQEQWDTWTRNCEWQQRQAHECIRTLKEKRSFIQMRLGRLSDPKS